MSVLRTLEELVENVVAFLVMILLGVVSFFITVFIVKWGARLAGYTGTNAPSADFVVLSAALLVISSILAGSMK